MKIMRNMNVPRIAVVLTVGLALYFGGCTQQSPIQPGDNETANSISTLSKVKVNGNGNNAGKASVSTYPQSASKVYKFHKQKGHYNGGKFQVQNNSEFILNQGALTPPAGIAWGDPVTITMTVDRDSVRNELIFTFGPSGCQFNPPAEVWFDWSDLGVRKATLYYIDDHGNYVEQKPDKIDRKGHRFKLYIDHFSRYAVAWSN